MSPYIYLHVRAGSIKRALPYVSSCAAGACGSSDNTSISCDARLLLLALLALAASERPERVGEALFGLSKGPRGGEPSRRCGLREPLENGCMVCDGPEVEEEEAALEGCEARANAEEAAPVTTVTEVVPAADADEVGEE